MNRTCLPLMALLIQSLLVHCWITRRLANPAPTGQDSAHSRSIPQANGPSSSSLPDTSASESTMQVAPAAESSNGELRTANNNNRDEVCPICLEPYGLDGNRDVFVACGHRYHDECIGKWRTLTQATRRRGVPCPVCRSNIYNPDGSDESDLSSAETEQDGLPRGIFVYGDYFWSLDL